MIRLQKLTNLTTIMAAAAFLVIVLVLGWRVWRTEPKPAASTQVPLASTYVDTAKRFVFNYPSDWTVFYRELGGTEGSVAPEPDWTVVSRPVLIEPVTGRDGNDVEVTPGCSAGTIAELKANTDRFHTQQDLTINGNGAFYDRLEFKGDAESYLHHTYVVLGGTDCLQIAYRQYWHHPMSGTDFDDSTNLPVFEAILNSVRFIN